MEVAEVSIPLISGLLDYVFNKELSRCADAIRARADERYPDESREMKP